MSIDGEITYHLQLVPVDHLLQLVLVGHLPQGDILSPFDVVLPGNCLSPGKFLLTGLMMTNVTTSKQIDMAQ